MDTPEEIASKIANQRYIGNYTNSRDIGGAGFRRAIALEAIREYIRQQREGSKCFIQ